MFLQEKKYFPIVEGVVHMQLSVDGFHMATFHLEDMNLIFWLWQNKDVSIRKVTMLEFRDVVVLKVGIEGQLWNNDIVNIIWLKIYIVKVSSRITKYTLIVKNVYDNIW